MKADSPAIIEHLNYALEGELASINQYFTHARMFGHWGYEKLEQKELAASMDEMKHADELIKRILYLEGKPNVNNANPKIGDTVVKALENDLSLEIKARKVLRQAIKVCEESQDHISRELLENILQAEEEHIEWLETQFNLVTSLGLQNYLQTLV